jgi:uncharacterized OsmC-like protein
MQKATDDTSRDKRPAVAAGQVLVFEQDKKFTRRMYTERHQLVADEPVGDGGSDLGPNPYEYLLAALGSCTSMTIRMYADHKQMKLDNVEVSLSHRRIHAEDCEECETKEGFVDRIDKRITLEGDLTEAERQRLLQIADRCPVHKTLKNEILIKSELA